MFHRIDDWENMPADRYCRLVPLLPAYGGAVADGLRRIARQAQEEQQEQQAAAPTVYRSGPPAARFSSATSGGGAA